MTEKELKRLNRRQLLELLILQTERGDRLQLQLDEANQKLEDRSIAITQSGHLAEAALRLSGIFECADNAAAVYLENMRKHEQESEQLVNQAREQAAAILAEAEAKCLEREREADEYYLKVEERIRKQGELMQEIIRGGK